MNHEEIKTLAELETKLHQYDGPDQVIESTGFREVLRRQRNSKTIKYLTSGIPRLDDLITGFYPGELSVISGPTKHGKTLLLQTFTEHFSHKEEWSLWFTYEVPVFQFLEQFGHDLPSFMLPAQLKSNSLDWIKTRIHEAKVKFDIQAVFIDHLHYLIDMSRHNISLEIGHVMRFLKKTAIELNVHIFLVAHMQKVKLEAEPDETDLRDSSFVGQECDNCFMVWRLKNEENASMLKIALNRRFGVMGKKVILQKEGPYLRERQNDYR